MADRVCVVDLGSNAVRLAVFEAAPVGLPHCVEFVRERVRLSEGMDAAGSTLQPEPMRRTLGALRRLMALAAADDCRILAVATSAVRDATNREEFVAAVASETGFELRVLSEQDEGYYAFVAARESVPLSTGWVVEIGGGSAQVTTAVDGELVDSTSAPLGAVRATERYPLDDPPTEACLNRMREGLSRDLAEFGRLHAVGGRMVGVSGTIKSLARVHQHRVGESHLNIHGYRLGRDQALAVTHELATLTVAERQQVLGMDPDRADVILAGLILLDALKEAGGYTEITVCRFGIREGLAFEALGNSGIQRD